MLTPRSLCWHQRYLQQGSTMMSAHATPALLFSCVDVPNDFILPAEALRMYLLTGGT